MRKKTLLTITMATMLLLAACGTETTNTKENTTQEDTQKETEEKTTEEETTKETEKGKIVEENGMRKEPVYTEKDLNITGKTGPMEYKIEGIQVSKLTATTDSAATLLGIEKDKEVAVVAINASAENTSNDTMSFYLGQATLTTNTKEQVESDMLMSEYIEGEYIGNVIQSGSLVYILKNSKAEEVKQVTLHIDAPSNSNYDTVGEPVEIELTLE